MNKTLRYILVGILAIGLLLVRYFETDLFYDPFIAFFKDEYYYIVFPDFEWSSLIYSLGYRYGLNALLSIAILYSVFNDKAIVKVATSIFALTFIILLLIFVYLLSRDEPSLSALFFVRRFIIQPVLLLLLLPAFYYHRLKN